MKNEHLHSENIRGCKIAWQEAGTGPALVLLHGIGGSSESWHRQIGQLKNKFRVVAWDMPGYGGSEKFKTSSPLLMRIKAPCGFIIIRSSLYKPDAFIWDN